MLLVGARGGGVSAATLGADVFRKSAKDPRTNRQNDRISWPLIGLQMSIFLIHFFEFLGEAVELALELLLRSSAKHPC